MKTILHWLKTNSVMLINAGSVFGTTIVTSVLGFVYWWVAARRFTPEAVGVGSASISSMALLGFFCMFGLGTVLITEIPRQPKKSLSLTSTSLVVIFLAAGIAGLLFAMIVPLFSHEFSYLNANILNIFLFALGISLTSVSWVLDQALVAFLLGSKQLQRNAFFAGSKLLLLALMSFLFSNLTGMSIYATWALGNLLSLIFVLLPIVLKSKRPLRDYLPTWQILRQIGGAALQHHLLNSLLQCSMYALPTIITILLSARVNAVFYVSWTIVNFVFYISTALTIVLHAINSANESALAQRARSTLGLAVVMIGLSVLVLQFLAPQVLSIFGASYVEGVWILRISVLAAFPLIIKDHYIAICRIQDRLKQAIWIIAPGCLLELTLAILGARLGGLLGLSLGWVLATYVEATLMAPTVYKAVFAVKSSSTALEGTPKEATKDDLMLVNPITWPNINTGPLPVIKLTHGGESELYGGAVAAKNRSTGENRYQFKSLYFKPLESSSSLSFWRAVVAKNRSTGEKQYQFKSLHFNIK